MRFASTGFVLAMLALGLLAGGASCTRPRPDQIQEDWQVVIGVPDPAGAGPQISTAMSPVTDGSTPSFVFDLNYQDSPSFIPGGMQVQVWSGDTDAELVHERDGPVQHHGRDDHVDPDDEACVGDDQLRDRLGQVDDLGQVRPGPATERKRRASRRPLPRCPPYSPDTSVTQLRVSAGSPIGSPR